MSKGVIIDEGVGITNKVWDRLERALWLRSAMKDYYDLRGEPCAHLRDYNCHAGQDGGCTWVFCPRPRDDEPKKTGRSCILLDCKKQSEEKE